MRDTLRLRSHLTLLACLPVAVAACTGEGGNVAKAEPRAAQASKAAPVDNGAEDGSKSGSKTQQTGKRMAAKKARKGPIMNRIEDEGPPPKLTPEQARLEPIPGDPPWIDGYNAEEDPCPSGNWCGTVETAMAIAPNPDSIATQMDCPTRVVGSHDPSPIKGRLYAGLSDKKAMQGSLNLHGTELARADGSADACCYHWFEYCSGRPLMDEAGPHRAEATRGMAWSNTATSPTPVTSPAIRAALAKAWVSDALDEHASVASFARATLELMAVGAPPELLADTQRAGLDEIDHAKRCFSLAQRFGATDASAGPLPALAPRTGGVAAVARNTFIEGCVGETIAALVAERAAASTTDGPTREALEVIAVDEARHAGLAWRTVAWALENGDPKVAEELRAAAQQCRRAARVGGQPDATLRPWGRLCDHDRRQAAADAWRDIIDPMLDDLLG